jgi:hypothetical protein
MKTTIHFLIILSFLLSNYTSIFAQTTLEKQKLRGEVKSISSVVYDSRVEEDEIALLDITKSSKQTFNESGYMTSNQQQKNSETMNEGPLRKKVYVLNEDNKVTKETSYADDVKGKYSQNTYKNGLLIEATYYKADETPIGTQSFTYDDNGNKLTSDAIDKDGKPIQKLELTYTKDNKVASTKNSRKGKLVYSAKYEYLNEKEEKIITLNTKTEEETIMHYSIKTHDDNKNILSIIMYTPDGTVKSTSSYEYNKQGDQTLTKRVIAGKEEKDYSQMRYEYDYDEKGNWIQKIEYLKNGESSNVTKREIEYYK